MRKSSQTLWITLTAAAFISLPAAAFAQSPSTNTQNQSQTQTQSQQGQSQAPNTSQPNQQPQTQAPNNSQGSVIQAAPAAPPPPPPPADTPQQTPAANSTSNGTQQQPASTDSTDNSNTTDNSSGDKTVHPKKSKDDVDAIGNRNIGKGVNFYSIEKEIALGKALAQEVERSSKMIDDPVITEYVNRVGQNLVRNSDAKVPFTIKVIDSDEVNAFALPGGFFYVNSGLILRAQEEDELAGVMAHEISHVAARHGTKQATKAELIQLGAMAAMIVVPYGWAGYGIYEGMNLAIPLTFLKFSRDDEREADYLGIQYMYKAGYDPNAYVTFFERILADEKRRPGSIPKMFSTHPPTPERIELAQKEIARILPDRDEYIVTTSEFDSVKSRLRNVMFARKVQDNQAGKPTLRTKTEQSDKNKNGDPNAQSSDGSDDDRPTLKRRPDSD
jgi:beta-barrel assembly-enhancing protease